MNNTTICHCGEDGYYSCVELREQLEITRNQLKDFLKTIEKSPREVVFDKEVLTLYVNGIINGTLKV